MGATRGDKDDCKSNSCLRRGKCADGTIGSTWYNHGQCYAGGASICDGGVCTSKKGNGECCCVPDSNCKSHLGKKTRHGSVNDRVNDARYASTAVDELYSAKANNIASSSTSAPAQAEPTSFPSSIGFASATEELAEVCSATPGSC